MFGVHTQLGQQSQFGAAGGSNNPFSAGSLGGPQAAGKASSGSGAENPAQAVAGIDISNPNSFSPELGQKFSAMG